MMSSIMVAMMNHATRKNCDYNKNIHDAKPELEVMCLRPVEIGKRIEKAYSTNETQSKSFVLSKDNTLNKSLNLFQKEERLNASKIETLITPSPFFPKEGRKYQQNNELGFTDQNSVEEKRIFLNDASVQFLNGKHNNLPEAESLEQSFNEDTLKKTKKAKKGLLDESSMEQYDVNKGNEANERILNSNRDLNSIRNDPKMLKLNVPLTGPADISGSQSQSVLPTFANGNPSSGRNTDRNTIKTEGKRSVGFKKSKRSSKKTLPEESAYTYESVEEEIEE